LLKKHVQNVHNSKKIRTFAKDYGCNWNFFPSGSVGALHKPSGSAVPDRNIPLSPENTISVKHLKTRKGRIKLVLLVFFDVEIKSYAVIP
jgi:hypothetical protein